MKVYPVGQRVRIIYATNLTYLVGMLGTVIGPPKSCQHKRRWFGTRRWIGQPVEVDGIGHEVPDPDKAGETVNYVPTADFLEPLDEGQPESASWDAVSDIINWSPDRRGLTVNEGQK